MSDAAAQLPSPWSVRALRVVLAVLAVLFALAAVLYELGPLALPNRAFFAQLPFVSNSVVKVGILLACCLYARGDLRERSGLVAILLAAHLVSVAAMGVLLIGMDTSRLVDPGFGGPQPVRQVLVGAMILDGVITAILAALYFAARGRLPRPTPAPARSSSEAYLTPAEQWLRRVLVLFGVIFVGAALLYEAGPLRGSAPNFFRELPFVTNSVVKVSTLAMVCFWVVRSLRARMSMVGPVIGVHFLSGVAQLIYLFAADPAILAQQFVLVGQRQTMSEILWGAIILDAVIGLALFALYQAAWRARFRNEFLRPTEFRTLVALADVMTQGADERVTPEDAARNVDRGLAAMETERKGMFRIALVALHYFPLLALWPPLPELAPAERAAYIKKRWQRKAGQTGLAAPLRTALMAITRLAHQLSVLGYYSDPRAFASIGYTPFSERQRAASLLPGGPAPPLAVEHAWDVPGDVIETEVLVVGTGAGGAMLAYGLAERGKSVLLVERGKYVQPGAFAEHELTQLGRLYDGGLIQVASDYRFGVLQGSCVGGSTTVNNAVCFDPPGPVVADWNRAAGLDAGIDVSDLEASTRWVRTHLDVRPLGSRIPPFAFHRGADKLRDVLGRPGADFGLTPPRPFDANIRADCFGCGKCNIGCPYDKKLSMLNATLPWAQRDFPGRVRILAECEVQGLRTLSGRPARVLDVKARLSDGRRITIRAHTFVLAAGALASSHLLLKSGIGRGLPVGKGVSFNMVAPVFAEFEDRMNSYDGIQMGHYVNDRVGDRFLIETWYSLPVGLALSMGGWFDQHFHNMRRSGHMAAYGMVVGTDRESSVNVNPLTGDLAFHHRPTPSDMARLTEGLGRLLPVLFEAGARRVIVNTWDHGNVRHPGEVSALLEQARDPRFISLASAHPQGGNPMSRSTAKGVLDDQFRVHGYANLFVCDASVFPTSLQVNPQLTVMALARYAVPRVAARTN